MLTLFSTLMSFLMGGLPKLLDFFQDRADKQHELALAQMQTERELTLKKAGLESQERVEAIHLDEIKVQAEVATQQANVAMVNAKLEERQALYAHDIEISKGASTWVINARAMVRPVLTYGMFMLLVFVDMAGFLYAWHSNVPFTECLNQLWDDDTQLIWASIVAFWFGSQAFEKK
jgi:hypothetical protein